MTQDTQQRYDYEVGEPLTVDELVQLWNHLDEPLTSGALNRLQPRLDRVMVVAYCVYVLLFVTILAVTFWGLRVVGGA